MNVSGDWFSSCFAASPGRRTKARICKREVADADNVYSNEMQSFDWNSMLGYCGYCGIAGLTS